MKIALLTLLLIFATVTTLALTVGAPNVPTPKQSYELDNFGFIVRDEVAPLGDDKEGGWGLLDKT